MASASDQLNCYISDTMTCVQTVRSFTGRSAEWETQRKAEIDKMNKINKQSPEATKQLKAVLTDSLDGLDNLETFLDAVEKLVVTSLHLFDMTLPDGTDQRPISYIINAAKIICPLLLQFKRDNKVFFTPKLGNVDVLVCELEHYIYTVQFICQAFKDSFHSDLCKVNFSKIITEENALKMASNIEHLHKIRMDPDLRMLYLFKGNHQIFMNEFTQCLPRMKQALEVLEGCAQQLDSMNQGATISRVVASSVGVVGGAMSIVGLILSPFTLGVSLALTGIGVGLGVTGGVQGLVTSATEVGVNDSQNNKAKEAFKGFVEDMSRIELCIDDVINQHFENLKENTLWRTIGAAGTGAGLGTGSANILKSFYTYKALRAGEAVAGMSKVAKGFSGVANALFIGLDVYFIIKDSISLHKGSETETSRQIRNRSALWRSEIDRWQKIYDSLERGQREMTKYKCILKKALCE